MARTLVGLGKILAILGVTLATVAAIIWVFTSILEATGNFPVAMLCVYLVGGLAVVAITFILNVGSKVKPMIAVKSTRTYRVEHYSRNLSQLFYC